LGGARSCQSALVATGWAISRPSVHLRWTIPLCIVTVNEGDVESVARDVRVQAAIENWYPRFVANGVDINDFQRITAELESWDEWCAAWSRWGAMHAALGQEAEEAGWFRSAAVHYWHAAMLYHFGKFMFFHAPEEHRAAHERTVALYEQALPYFDPPAERVEIPYENGTIIPGILRKPAHAVRPPVVVLIPGLDSVKEEMHAYGEDFLARGMAVLAMDGPGQGELEFDLPMRFDYEVPLGCVLDYLDSRKDLDSRRVGAMGVSFGGYYALRASSHDPRLGPVIALATGYRFVDYFERVPILTREALIHRLHAGDEDDARARLARFDLHGSMHRLGAPALIVMGRKDRLFPAEAAEEMVADSAGKATLVMYDDGNHVCNNIPYKYRPMQADWMMQQLGVS
jgi:dienelactone hydrolase